MLFKYTGYDKDGLKVTNTIESMTIEMAKKQLKQQQIIYTKISEDKFNFFAIHFLKRKRKLKALLLSTLTRDLSIYLNSGISLIHAVKLLSQRYKKDTTLYPFFVSLIASFDEGKNFYTSLAEQKSVELPEFYLQSIKISEDGGVLPSVLIELAQYLKEQDTLNKQMSSAMAYPIFIIIVSFFMVGFMLSFIVPKITAVFEQNGQALPSITQFVISAGDFVNSYYILLISGSFFTIVFFSFLLKKYARLKYSVDRFLLQIPFVGKLIETAELGRFAYMNSLLIKSGIPIVQSFKLGSNIIKNSVLKKLFMQASSEVVEGKNLSTLLDKSKIYTIDTAFIQAISIGEETSSLDKVLENLSELYMTQNKDKIAILLTLLEPLFMLIVGGLIGFIVIAMLLPIFSMSLA